jgi:ribosome-binding factor A
MMNFKRADRVADLIKAEISDILLKRVRDPRVAHVTITGVKLTDDLRSARVFFVQMGESVCSEETMTGMRKATGFLKKELGKRLQLRYVPAITFVYDESFGYGSRIDRLLEEIKEKETDA